MMRRSLVCAAAAAALLLKLGSASAADAQILAYQATDPEPRFLLASTAGNKPVEIDVERTPILQRRLSLDLAGTTLKQALAEISAQSGLNLTYSDDIVPLGKRVHLRAEAITVVAALTDVLLGTGVDVVFNSGSGSRAALVRRPPPAVGTITGRVTDAATGQGIAGVSIVVEGTKLGARTGAGGEYRVTGVPAGKHTVVAVMLGYARQTQEVTVGDGTTAEVAFALAREAIAMDELVVTGTIAQTKVRALPSPITVVNSEEIERLAIQRPDQLFRGVVAGATTFDNGPFNHYASVSMRGANSIGSDHIKTYVDGVEVSDPLYITTIDPSSIDRIELLRGPQATTVYGSGASGGVMQIFTKKGQSTARPTLHFKTAAGMIDGHWNGGDAVMQTDNSLSISGGGEEFSYNFGGSHTWYDAYVPGAYSKDLSTFGTLKVSQGPLQATLSGRWYRKNFHWPQYNPILREQGYEFYPKEPRMEQDYIHQKGISLDLNYAATSYWAHNLTAGYESNNFEQFTYEKRLRTPADTLYDIMYYPTERMTLRYNTSLQFYMAPELSTTLVAGADYSEGRSGGFYTWSAGSPWGTNPGDGAVLYHNRDESSGYFVQGTFGFRDRLFLTTGVRMEVSDNLGDDYGNAFAPRVGLAYSFGLEGVEMKARTAWGRGIKLPHESAKTGSVGSGYRILPNPKTGPEEVVGFDAGLEFQFRDRGKLAITYYDQMAKGLIESVTIDVSDPVYGRVLQYQNVGEIANTGWELEGEVYLRPFPVTLKGTFTTTKSIMEKGAPDYTGDIQIGDTMPRVPKYSGGLTATYSHPKGALALTATHLGPWRNFDMLSYYGFAYGGDEYRGSMRDYLMDYDGVTKYSLNTSFSLSPKVQAYLLADNLTNNVGKEGDNNTTDRPRSFMFGLRFTY